MNNGWNKTFPGKRTKILNRIRAIRGGKLNDPRFGSRMSGEGIFAEQISQMFHVARRKVGLSEDGPDFPPPPSADRKGRNYRWACKDFILRCRTNGDVQLINLLVFFRISDNTRSRGSSLADLESTNRKIWLSLFLIIISDYACISYRRDSKRTVANEVCFVAGDGRARKRFRKKARPGPWQET